MFDSIYPADLPRRQPRGSEHGYKSWWCSHRCDREVPVWCGYRSLILAGELQRNGGKCYCHLSSLLPEGYFESRALGRLTAPNPSSKSFW